MVVFVDFETKGLNGEITEACAVSQAGDVINYQEGDFDFDKFINDIVVDGSVIVFWHHFMPVYLSKYRTKLFNELKGKFLTFVDFYAIFDYVKQPKYSIQEITKILTGRDHKGNAKDDALDLCECYRKMQ